MKFPRTSYDIYRAAQAHNMYNFELVKDKRNVLIVTPAGIKTIFGYYCTHSITFWLDAIRETLAGNHTTPNIT